MYYILFFSFVSHFGGALIRTYLRGTLGGVVQTKIGSFRRWVL